MKIVTNSGLLFKYYTFNFIQREVRVGNTPLRFVCLSHSLLGEWNVIFIFPNILFFITRFSKRYKVSRTLKCSWFWMFQFALSTLFNKKKRVSKKEVNYTHYFLFFFKLNSFIYLLGTQLQASTIISQKTGFLNGILQMQLYYLNYSVNFNIRCE